MKSFQIASVSDPFAGDGEALYRALALLNRAEMMSLLPDESEQTATLDYDLSLAVAGKLADAGLATGSVATLRNGVANGWDESERGQLRASLGRLLDALDESPYPEGEWGPARELLDDEVLAALTGISTSSLRRYASGERRTPDAVAWRLHSIARILGALRSGYNAYGARRWFERPRTALGGRTPAQVIVTSTDESELEPVIALAEALQGAGSAT